MHKKYIKNMGKMVNRQQAMKCSITNIPVYWYISIARRRPHSGVAYTPKLWFKGGETHADTDD